MHDRSLDPAEILPLLGLPRSTPAIPVAGGADTAIWRVEHGGIISALRVFRPDQAAACQREIAAMVAAAAQVPVPKVRASGIWQERPSLLLTWMPGRPLAHEICARPWRAWRLGLAFGQSQAAIHALSPPAALLRPRQSWIDWAQPDDVLRDRLLSVSGEAARLLHLDYHPMNVLVARGKVSAVLDWTNARAGDPRADLARTASILLFGPGCAGLPAGISGVVRTAFVAGWRRGYRGLAGPISGMAPFYAWAGALMVRDLSPRLGRTDLPWLTEELLVRVQMWADRWRASSS